VVNQVFSPSEAEVTRAQRVISAMEEAKKEGRGAVTLDGRLIDLASIRQAEVMVRKAKVVIRTEVQYPLPIHLQPGSLRRAQSTDAVIQTTLFQVLKLILNPLQFG